jgi:hypothetical protein
VNSGELVCEECERRSTAEAQGWQGHLVDLDDDGQDDVVFYCPGCAAREFGWQPPQGGRQRADGS